MQTKKYSENDLVQTKALAPCSKVSLEHKKSYSDKTLWKLKPSPPRAQRATWWNFHCLIFIFGNDVGQFQDMNIKEESIYARRTFSDIVNLVAQ